MVCGNESRAKVQGLFDVLVKRIQELEADLDETQATILQLETTIVVLTRQLHVEKDLLGNSNPFVALQSPTPRLEDHIERKTPKLSDSTKTVVRTLNASLEEIRKRSEEETAVWQREKKEMQKVNRLQEEVLAAANANVRTLNASLEEIRKRSEEETAVWQREKKEMQKVNRLQEEVLAAANANVRTLNASLEEIRKRSEEETAVWQREKKEMQKVNRLQEEVLTTANAKASLEKMHARPDGTSGPKVDSPWLTAQDAMTVVQLGRRKGSRTRDRLPWGCLSGGVLSSCSSTRSQSTVDVDLEPPMDALDTVLSHWHGLASYCTAIEQLLDEMDTNNDKVLSLSEVTLALRRMNLTDLGEEEISAIYRDLGGEGNTGVDIKAFENRLRHHREKMRLIDLLQGRINFTALIAELVLPKFGADQLVGSCNQKHDHIASLSQLSDIELQRRLAPLVKKVVSHVREVSRTVEQFDHQRGKAKVGWKSIKQKLDGITNLSSGKFSMPVRQAQFGHLDIFHKGLNALIGLPATDILGAMQLEHEDETQFVTSNYHLNTNPLLEWEFVVNPDLSRTYPGEKIPGNINGRERKLLAHLMLVRECIEAGLTEEEVIALRLYTGPMFQHYNKVLRECLRRHLLRYAKDLVRRWKDCQARSARQSPSAHQSQGRRRSSVVSIDSLEELTHVSLEELVDAASRLGMDHNGSAAEVAERLLIAACDLDNTSGKPGFTTTIHMINSGIMKLAQCMRLPKSRTVYRGLGGTALPNCFFKPNEFGCRGGTEAAFMSTTLDSATALQYISDLPLPIVFELSVGQVDRGAEVKWCSQYPGENEVLFSPLCNIEVIGNPSTKLFGSGDDVKEVLAFTCKISVNFKCMSREELECRRYTQLLSSLNYTYQEIERDLNRQVHIVAQQNPHKAAEGEEIVQKILEECEKLIACHRSTDPKDYNESEGFHQMALQDCAMLPSMALAKFSAWYDRGLCYPSNFSELSMHEWQVFFQGEQWKKYEIKLESLKRVGNNKEEPFPRERQISLQESALPLIHDRGLFFTKKGSMTLPNSAQRDPPASHSMQQPRRSMNHGKPVALNELDGFRNGHTALMRAVFNGDPFDVELLLSVGCSVDVQDEAGRTGLMCSIILGEHKQQIEIARNLIRYGARLDSSTGTLLHTAARCGRTVHAEMLLEAAAQRGGGEEACHAYASVTTTNTGANPLLLAAQCGHVKVFELLAHRFPHLIPLSKNDGMTALDMAAWNNRVEITRILLDKGGEELILHQDDRGWTCLFRAVDQGHLNIIKLLLQASDCTCAEKLLMLRDKEGLTCFDLAQTRWGIETTSPNPAVLQLLNGGWKVAS